MKEKKRFTIIDCSGASYQIGLQYGQACRENIIRSIRMNVGGAVYNGRVGKDEILANAEQFLPTVKKFDPYLIEMLEGMAEGAGVLPAEVFALRCMLEVDSYYNSIAGFCTSFAAAGKATADGKTILGQNIDSFPGTPLDLLRIRHSDGLEQLTLSLGGVLEYTLSSAGFGICANSLLTPVEKENYTRVIPAACYLPRVMRQHSIIDALGLLSRCARGTAYYHLAGADGCMTGIESVFDQIKILLPEKDMLAHTNHYLDSRFRQDDLASSVLPDSFSRRRRMCKLMQKYYGGITKELMMEILADHDNHPGSICRHTDNTKPAYMNSETLASIIMVPEDGTMYITCGNPCRYEYEEYRLKSAGAVKLDMPKPAAGLR